MHTRSYRRLLAVVLSVAPVLALGHAAPASAATQPVPPTPAGVTADLEQLPGYVPANSCDSSAKPGVLRFASLIQSTYAGTGSYGISSSCASEGGISEHTQGRAWDWKVSVSSPAQVAQVQALFAWLLAPDAQGRPAANARRTGVMYIIWNKQIFGLYRPGDGWRPYSCSGVTACHQDHVHFSFTWAGARAATSYWSGHVAPTDYGPCTGPGQMFALPVAVARAAPCPARTYVAATSPVVTGLQTSPSTVLAPGATGTAVAAVQRALGGTTPDGDFGPATSDLVTTFQERRGLPATGIVNVATRSSLIDYVSGGTATLTPAPVVPPPAPHAPPAPPAPPAPRYAGVVLRLGTSGPAVAALQKYLHVRPDGWYGPPTLSALLAFKRAHHLPLTTVVDRATWVALAA